jgi:hypothetical protein
LIAQTISVKIVAAKSLILTRILPAKSSSSLGRVCRRLKWPFGGVKWPFGPDGHFEKICVFGRRSDGHQQMGKMPILPIADFPN